MKVVILAGGYGTRLAEYTETVPKPMVKIGDLPILVHIMNIYSYYGHNDFYLALGYKGNLIKEFFLNFSANNKDFQLDLDTGEIKYFNQEYNLNWKVTLIDTGKNSFTGRRIKLMQPYIGKERFFITYGDGLSNINLDKLLNFHEKHGKICTITAVRPPARFGELNIDSDSSVISFKEKPQLNEGWINGGFLVVEPEFINKIPEENVMLEKEPMDILTQDNQLKAYKHEGFWQCMDTVRDKKLLEDLYSKGAPWIIKN
tara:strand:+ start:6023 stop:6796 length:774 start_codon:yes stop_codon:yes gene_type:complete